MKRFSVALIALVASVAIGMATVSTTAGAARGDHAAQVAKKKKKKKKKKFAATISLTVTVTPADTYSPGSGTFTGAVSSGGPAACRSGRGVTISRNGAPVASATTDASGAYSASVNAAPAAGQYTASTPTVVIKKKGKKNKNTGKRKKKKTICLAAASSPVTVS
jgi:hypothetical protein